MKTAFSFVLVLSLSLLSFSSHATQKTKSVKAKSTVQESWTHDDLMAYLKDHPEKMDLEAVSTIRAQNTQFSEADKLLLYAKYLMGLRGGAFFHYYHFWTFFHTDISKAGQAELAAEIIKETAKNFNEHSREMEYDSCSYFLPYLIQGAKEWYTPSATRNAKIDSIRSMQLWGVVKLMERNTGWLFAHVGNFSFSKDLMAECDSFRQFSIPYTYDLNPELTLRQNKAWDDKFLYSPAMATQPLGAALNIYQIVLNYYSADTLLRDRLILADLMRLQFVNTCFSGPSANTAWREAIQRLLVHNGTNPSSTLVAAQLATYLYRLSKENESPEQGSAASWYRFQAYQTAKQFSSRFPTGLGFKACRMLMREIAQSDFSAEMDEQWYPNKPSLLKLKYKNMRQLYVYVFDLKNPNDTAANPEPGTLLKLQQFPLKEFGDYYQHRTQLALEGLPAGRYYIELADTVLTYENAARLATYINVAPARIVSFVDANGKQQASVVDISNGKIIQKKLNVSLEAVKFPMLTRAKSGEILIGGKSEIKQASANEYENNLNHSLPIPNLTLNKPAYAPGDMVECIAKISARDYARYIHLGGYYPNLLNAGQAINVQDFFEDEQQKTRKLFWFNEDNQFVLRYRLDSVLRDGDYLLQVGDASINIPVRNQFSQGTFSINGPQKASFGERMHFTAQWKKGTNEKFIPKQVNVAVAMLDYNFGKAGISRHIANAVLSLDSSGSFTYDFVPVPNATTDANLATHYLARYTFTWSFIDSAGQTQTQYNRYYASTPERLLLSELSPKVEYNSLLESYPIIKAIDGDGLMNAKYPCTARIIRLRPPFLAPVQSDFMPDYFALPVDTFRSKFPYFAYAGESNLENLTTRDTVLTIKAATTDALSNNLFSKLQNGAYELQIQSDDDRLKSTIAKHRFRYINPSDEKTECPEWLSISYYNDGPYYHCAQKGQTIQCYFYSDKGIIAHSVVKSTGKWKKLKFPAGTRYVLMETYLGGKHIVRSWAYPEIAELL